MNQAVKTFLQSFSAVVGMKVTSSVRERVRFGWA